MSRVWRVALILSIGMFAAPILAQQATTLTKAPEASPAPGSERATGAAKNSESAGNNVYYDLALSDLTIIGGELPSAGEEDPASNYQIWRQRVRMGPLMHPYAVGEGGAELYMSAPAGDRPFRPSGRPVPAAARRLHIQAPRGSTPQGRLFFPSADWTRMTYADFKVEREASADQEAARTKYLEARLSHYQRLLGADLPGAAWFRHEVRETRRLLARPDTDERERIPRDLDMMLSVTERGGRGEFEDTFNLFTGGRALSENLQLERTLNVVSPSSETIPLASLSGISAAEYDWKAAIQGASPKKDALAAFVPSDQHAVFFPSFQAMLDLMDEASARGAPILHLLEPRSEDAGTREFYQRQLCLEPDALSRVLGPAMIASVAFTGSDPYLRTGSDVAVLFEAREARALATSIAARQKAGETATPGAKAASGEIRGVAWAGVESPDRALRSYRAVLGGVVVVANSLAQLERIVATSKGAEPRLSDSDEYAFFRMRYPLGDPEETALLALSDATIRRWCGPRWRIGASRRTRAAAALSELQAGRLAGLAAGTLKPGPLDPARPVPGLGAVTLTPRGVSSDVYGSFEFLAPIIELQFDKATEQEARAYERFRDLYQSNWRRYFDPIAVRFRVGSGGVAADITVRPLIAGSEYRPLMEVTGNGALGPASADPHPEAVFHLAASLNPDSEPVKQAGNFMMGMAPSIGEGALNWIGAWAAVFGDADPFWSELEAAAGKGQEQAETFMESNVHRLPVALGIAVKNPLKLAAFLAAFRAFIEQTSPGLTAWESLSWRDQPYVRVGPSASAKAEMDKDEEGMKNLAVFYAATPKALILSLNEPMLKRALDRLSPPTPTATQPAKSEADADGSGSRAAAPAAAETSATMTRAWLGTCLAARATHEGLSILQALYAESLKDTFRRRSWAALAVLNEWKRRLGQDDPVAFHERCWGVRLVDPAGGSYVWNEEYRTMESTVFGHPGRPRPVVDVPDPLAHVATLDLGVTFEADGLRAAGRLERKAE